MRDHRDHYALLALAALFLSSTAVLASEASGRVLKWGQEDGGGALQGVKVEFYVGPTKVGEDMTESDGTWSVTVPNGAYQIKIERTGYYGNFPTVNVSGDTDFGDYAMKKHLSDPPQPAPPNDYDYQFSTSLGEAEMVIHFDSGTPTKHYTGFQDGARVRIYSTEPNFAPACACSDFAKATNGPDETAYRVHHAHCRYEYGTGPPGAPAWGSTPAWPTMSQGKAFWDWAYTGHKTGSGGNPSIKANCVQFAFNGRNQASIRVASAVWVDSSWTDATKLWNALQTTVYPKAGQPSFDMAKVNHDDIAGNEMHVWVLLNPAGGNGNGPATRIKWVNETSGEYTLNRPATPGNCAPKVRLTGERSVPGTTKLKTADGHVNTPYFDEDRIKR